MRRDALAEYRRNALAARVAAQAERLEAGAESLYEFITRVSPRYEAPRHLDPIVSLLNRALEGGVESCSSTPPRHTKTSTIVHWIVKTAATRPGTMLGYATYNQTRADSVSATARLIAERAGCKFDRDSLREWRMPNGSKVIWGGVGGGWTGEGFHLVAVDDPFKDREEAESPLIREKVWEWFNDVIYTRQEPGVRGTSFIVNHTRWHVDDLIGRLVKRLRWEWVNLPAIDDNNQALWPSGFALERLRKTEAQVGPYTFASLYQGQPIAKGAEVFGPPTFYDDLPIGVGFRTSVGGDFAYTIRTWSDFSVAVVFRRYTTGLIYVVDVLRERIELPAFRRRLRALADRHGALNQIGAFVSGTEKGGLSFFDEGHSSERVYVEPYPATTDKYMRAQPLAGAWNAGRVLVPRTLAALGDLGTPYHQSGKDPAEVKPPWLEAFLDELRSFTGVKDAFDDQIDGAAGAFEPFRAMTEAGDAPIGSVVSDIGSRYGDGDEGGRWF